jgi:hypothetical protein
LHYLSLRPSLFPSLFVLLALWLCSSAFSKGKVEH